MIQLINENSKNLNEVDIYVDMLPYEETLEMVVEDMIQPDEKIKSGDDYSDQIDTRKFLKLYLKNDVVPTIKTYPSVKSCWVRNASEETRTGLSNYVDLIFKHPKDLTKEELNSLLDDFNTHPKKVEFRVQILPTTIYNFKELL